MGPDATVIDCGNAKRMQRDHRILDGTAAALLMAARLFRAVHRA
jgi:hypothetical protein